MEPLMGIIGLVIIIGICAIIDSYNKRAKKKKKSNKKKMLLYL